MVAYVCSQGGCGKKLDAAGYCAEHARSDRRSAAAKRGRYGKGHRSKKKESALRIESEASQGRYVNCARCGEPILPGEEWDEGHATLGSSGGPEHRGRCNRAAGARDGNKQRRTDYSD